MTGAAKITIDNIVKDATHQAENHSMKKGTPKSASWWMATAVATAVVMAA